MRLSYVLSIIIVFLLIAPNVNSAKIDPMVLSQLENSTETPVIIVFNKTIEQHERLKKIDLTEINSKIKKEIKFRQDKLLSKLSLKSKNTKNYDFEVKKKFSSVRALYGVATKSGIKKISEDPDVLFVTVNRVFPLADEASFNISLTTSVSTIGASTVRTNYNYTGRNITVSIVDTGVDYTHPDLGGCFGTGCRIKDGYDFVDNDNVPMDGHGHGTHVAGIVGANGTMVGVAPEVEFYAVRVCNDSGCSVANMIQGIDWSIGHNADIIQFSIGGENLPNNGYDVTSIIMDDAVRQGIVCVVSAGNDGPSTGSTSGPADAINVITVGSSSDAGTTDRSDDTLSSFSSMGPSAFGRLDPDLLAPGSSITSTYLVSGGSYKTWSGTSMATPHISGAAALLLESNRSLSPSDIRQILMNSAGSISRHVFEEGAGLINLSAALSNNVTAKLNDNDRLETIISPGAETFVTLSITNTNDYPINFTAGINNLSDMEGNNVLSNDSFIFPTISADANSISLHNILIRVSNTAKPAIYGSVLVLSFDNRTIRLPVVLTIPLQEEGRINGSVKNYNHGCSNSLCGDRIYYLVTSHNASRLYFNLSWSSTSDDLDLYVMAPNGVILNSSILETTNSELVSITNSGYNEYYALVYTYDLANSPIEYNLTVYAASNLSVNPSFIEHYVPSNSTIVNFSFMVSNDLTAKQDVSVSLNNIVVTDENHSTDLSGSNQEIIWQVPTSEIMGARYITSNISWDNEDNDLDLEFAYYNGSSWVSTSIGGYHYNNLTNLSREDILAFDILYYVNTYSAIGLRYLTTNSSQHFNLSVSLSSYNQTDAFISPSMFNLSSGEQKTVDVTLNLTSKSVVNDYMLALNSGSTLYSSLNVRILNNTPPSITNVTLSPLIAYANTTLECNSSGTDFESHSLTAYYNWYNGSGWTNYNNQTITGGFLRGGVSLKCSVILTDSFDNSSVMESNLVTIQNTVPIITNVTLTPLGPYTNDTLYCNATVYDPDAENILMYYNWSNSSGLMNITDYYLNDTFTVKGETYNCSVIAVDSNSSSAISSSNTVSILNSNVSILYYYTENLTPSVTYGGSLDFNITGYDLDNDTLYYFWIVNGSLVGYEYNLTQSFSGFMPGHYNITGIVSDGTVNSSVYWNVTVISLESYPPLITSISVSPSSPYTDDNLYCLVNYTDPDSNVTLYYNWYNSTNVLNINTSFLNATETAKDIVYNCSAYADDGVSNSSTSFSLGVRILNSNPIFSSYYPANLSQDVLRTQLYGFNISGYDIDNDTLSYYWLLNSSVIGTNYNISINFSQYYASSYNLTAILSDSTINSSLVFNITISNTPPYGQITLPENGSTVELGTPINFTAVVTDIDLDNISYYWDFNDTSNSTLSSINHTFSETGVYTVSLNYSDGINYSTSFVTVTIHDSTSPNITNISYVSDVRLNSNTTVNATIFDYSNLSYVVLTFLNQTINQTSNYSWLITNTTILGQNNFTINATDAYNNSVLSEYLFNVTSCSDSIKNGDETATDCGGSCSACTSDDSGSSGGGGGGGGGGSLSQTSSSTLKSMVLAQLTENSQSVATITESLIPVTTIKITPLVSSSNVNLRVETLGTVPVKTLENTYRYLRIDVGLLNSQLSESEIEFSVPVSYLISQNADPATIVLQRYYNDDWNSLPTTLKSQNSTSYNFVSRTPGFSYFAITFSLAKNVSNMTANGSLAETSNESGYPVSEKNELSDNSSQNTSDKNNTAVKIKKESPGQTSVQPSMYLVLIMIILSLVIFYLISVHNKTKNIIKPKKYLNLSKPKVILKKKKK